MPPTFYNQFWGILQWPFFECVKQSVEEGELPLTLRKGIITPIHKGKELDGNDLGNYRPITLTNTDYKILTKAMAIRLQKVISSIVSEDQVGFVKGRNIASYLRLFDDMTKCLNQANKPGSLIALDFSKAFDTLSKPCVLDALEMFKFGPKFQNLVTAVMKNTQKLCTQRRMGLKILQCRTRHSARVPFKPSAIYCSSGNTGNKDKKQFRNRRHKKGSTLKETVSNKQAK